MLPCAPVVCTSDLSCGSAPGHRSSHRGTHQEQHAYVRRSEVTLKLKYAINLDRCMMFLDLSHTGWDQMTGDGLC